MAPDSIGEESNPASLNAERADPATTNVPAAEAKTDGPEVMVLYPEYWIG